MQVAAIVLALLGLPDGTLIDQVVAVVDKEVVTRTELLAEARVALALREGEAAATATLDEEILSSFRTYLINQILVAAQARRLAAAEVSTEEVEREVERFANRFRSASAYQAFLRRYDVSPETLRRILRRDLRNARYIEQRMRARLVGGSAAGPTSEEYRRALESWLAELRQSAEIRLPGPAGELEAQDDDENSASDAGRSGEARRD